MNEKECNGCYFYFSTFSSCSVLYTPHGFPSSSFSLFFCLFFTVPFLSHSHSPLLVYSFFFFLSHCIKFRPSLSLQFLLLSLTHSLPFYIPLSRPLSSPRPPSLRLIMMCAACGVGCKSWWRKKKGKNVTGVACFLHDFLFVFFNFFLTFPCIKFRPSLSLRFPLFQL